MASPLTVYSSSADGYVSSSNATYATARAGGTLAADATLAQLPVGQRFSSPNHICYEQFISWDTSSIPAGATVTLATISLYVQLDQSDTDFTIEVRPYDWSTTVTTADWIAGASLSGLTLLASKGTAGISTVAYTALTSEAALLSAIVTGGTTRVVVDSSRHVAGNQPSALERVYFYMNEKGAGYQPKLYVEYTDPPAASTPIHLLRPHIIPAQIGG
jgi:hypothetical protein